MPSIKIKYIDSEIRGLKTKEKICICLLVTPLIIPVIIVCGICIQVSLIGLLK
jgi:hypothetical protein